MSVDQIKKFLEDASAYPDTTMVKIGDTEVPLASLRALNAVERENLSTAIKNNDTLSKQLNADRNKVIDLANKAQKAYDAAEEARAKAAEHTPAPGTDWREDPWYKPIAKEIDDRDAKFKDAIAKLGQLASVVSNAATIFTEDRWDRQYSSIDFGKREKKPTREELIEFAKTNNIFDRHKLPDVRAAWDKMTEADREKEKAAAEYEKGREAGRMEQLAARIPQPGVPGAGQPPSLRKPDGNTDILGDLYAESLKDPELRAMLEQLPSGMV